MEGFFAFSLSSSESYQSTINSLSKHKDIYMVEPFYRQKYGQPLMLGESFSVIFKNKMLQSELEQLASDYGVEFDYCLFDKISVFKNKPESGYNVLDISNLFHDLEQVEYGLPDFEVIISQNSYNLYDHYHEFQYHIKKVIGDFNNKTVWDFAGLDNYIVNVAILDDGFTTHEDLPSEKFWPGRDLSYNTYDYDASPGHRNGHGMAVAGIIGADHCIDSSSGNSSSTGIISMNPNIKIIPIKIFPDSIEYEIEVIDGDTILTSVISISNTRLTYAFYWATHNINCQADIIINSWNFYEFNNPISSLPNIEDAISYAVHEGRESFGDSIGAAVFFSAGNSNGRVGYPARYVDCFAVGAIDTFDVKQSYSSYGDDLELVTYSAGRTPDFWSLDQMGILGENDAPLFLGLLIKYWYFSPTITRLGPCKLNEIA